MTAPDFSKNPYGQAPPPGYGDAPSSPPGYGQPPPPGYGQAPPPGYGYGAPQAPYGQAPYGQAPYGQAPYGQAPYGQAPYGVAGVQKPTGWFVVNWLFFWPLAIYSLVSAWGNIDRALFAGDLAGAQYHANRVRKFGIIALCIGIGWIALWIIISVAVAGSASSSYCSGYNC